MKSDVACESTSAANGPSLAHVTRRPWALTSRLGRYARPLPPSICRGLILDWPLVIGEIGRSYTFRAHLTHFLHNPRDQLPSPEWPAPMVCILLPRSSISKTPSPSSAGTRRESRQHQRHQDAHPHSTRPLVSSLPVSVLVARYGDEAMHWTAAHERVLAHDDAA